MAFEVHSVKYNYFMNLLLTGCSILFPLITFPLVSRALLADAYGLVNFASSTASWLSLIAMLGVNRYGTREIARVRDNPAELARTTREIFAVTLASTLIVFACFIVSIFLVERFSQDRTLFFMNSITVICNTLGVSWFFQGIEQYRYITVRGVIVQAVCLLGVIFLVHSPGDYLVYAALLIASSAVANLVNFFYMLRLMREADAEAYYTRARLEPKRHIRPLLVFFLIVAAISIYTMLDTVMLGFLSTNEQVGFYSSAIAVKNALVALVSALSNVLLPRTANLYAHGEHLKFKKLVRKAVRVVLLLSVPLSVVVAVLATPLMTWYAGAAFAGAGPALSVVALAVIPIGLSVIFCDEVLIQIGREATCTWIYLAAAIIDFVGNLVLIPILGALGAAISTLFVEVLITLIEFILVRPYLWGGADGYGRDLPPYRPRE
ncbi:MAG: flippase [Coriobacteriales bacterium]|jgi:O-antigen/teichoic acid export membrane protein